MHHIIPIAVLKIVDDRINIPELDCEENMIVVCKKCHGLLTPRSILQKFGMAKLAPKYDRRLQFYETLGAKDVVSAVDVLDVFDEVFKWPEPINKSQE